MLLLGTALSVFAAGSLIQIARHLDTGKSDAYTDSDSLLTTLKAKPLDWSPVYMLLIAIIMLYGNLRQAIFTPASTPVRLLYYFNFLLVIGATIEYALKVRKTGNYYVPS